MRGVEIMHMGSRAGGALRAAIGLLLLICLLAPCGEAIPYLDWQKCLGGGYFDYANGVQLTADGGYVVAGYAKSNDGDVSGNHNLGYYDYWVVKLGASGKLLWQKCLGGSKDDYAQSVQPTADGGLVVAGDAKSNDGDVSGNHGIGIRDYWIVKLGEIDCTITAPDVVYSGSTGNAASTEESGAAYAWSITNGAITSASYAQSISFTAGTSGTTRLAVNVTKKGSWDRCYKDIVIKPKLDSGLTSDLAVPDNTVQKPSGMESHERDSGDSQVSSRENKVRVYPG